MARALKYLLWFVGGFVALFAIAAVALTLFFDPNDFREDISTAVKKATGRDFVIEGDITLDVFPWLAVEVGKAHLGNSPDFGDGPMATIDGARFSVRLLPAIVKQDVVVGAADVDGLQLNLAVNKRGVGNWSDLIGTEGSGDAESDSETTSVPDIDINSIEISNSVIRYSNAEAGETIVLEGFDLRVGRLKTDSSSVPIDANLAFDVQPAGLSGTARAEMTLSFDAEGGVLTLTDVAMDGAIAGVAAIPTSMSFSTDKVEIATHDHQVSVEPLMLAMLDVQVSANVQPFSYENRITPSAAIIVEEFSPRSIMQLFDVSPPVTSDPSVLSRMKIEADAKLTTTAIELSDVSVQLDDSMLGGTLSVPRIPTGSFEIDLSGDAIDLARYMEPASEAATASNDATGAVDIPVDLIRPLRARGKLRLKAATLGDIAFENVDLGLTSGDGKLRLFPVSADLFGGSYKGDVRIDVTGSVPALSVNEKIDGVDLASLAKAMFDQDNVTGSIDGSFVLSGRGANSVDIQRDLSGNMALHLKDGTYEGTDIWYELRRARALLKQEPAPEPTLPAKTAFSKVQMTGVVSRGILRSDDLSAELPFMQLSGRGEVDIPAATVDYSLTARILERPESLPGATAEELEEFTEAVIPLRISGPLSSPSIKPDLERMLRERVEDEIKDKLEDKLKDLFS